MAYSDVILADSPWAYWRLGEPSGVTADNAEGTAAYDGTYNNAPTLGVSGAIPNDSDTAVTFDGVDQDIACGALGSLGSSLGSGVSVEYWVKSTTADNPAYVFHARQGVGQTAVFVALISGQPHIDFQDSAGVDLTGTANSGASLLDGEWHHVVITATPSTDTITVYVDAVSRTVSYTQQNTPSSFANFAESNISRIISGGYTDHSLDEIAVYDSVLTASQAAAHYAASAISDDSAAVRWVHGEWASPACNFPRMALGNPHPLSARWPGLMRRPFTLAIGSSAATAPLTGNPYYYYANQLAAIA